MNTVSKSIKRLRLQNNMTQDQLAEKMYVTRQTISNWETEKAQPDLETLTSLAEVFNTDSVSISARLGHAQVSTTANIYAHALPKRDKDNSDALEKLFLNNKQSDSSD